jgi:hypothetical protein
MTRRSALVCAAVGILSAAVPAVAHHAWPVDMSRQVTVTGTVTEFLWANPHVMIALDVKDANGQIVKWSVGGPSTTRMERNGWSKDTLKPGEVITGTGYPFQDGQKVVRLEKIVRASGQEMLLYGRR